MTNFAGGWLGPLMMLGLLIGVVLVVAWAVNVGWRRSEDVALSALRVRLARGEIDGNQFEEVRRTLGAAYGPRAGTNLGLTGLVLIVAVIVLGLLLGSSMPGGWGMPGLGGTMGGGGMMGMGAGPTAPAATSVRMAGSRFEPSTLTIASGETVRWFNDDALPHTVSGNNGEWDSGNLAPGQGFERRFDEPGSFPYLCRYHPGMAGTIEVEA